MQNTIVEKAQPEDVLCLSSEGIIYASKQATLGISKKLKGLFEIDDALGVLYLGLDNVEVYETPSVSFWQKFSHLFLNTLCQSVNHESVEHKLPVPEQGILKELIDAAPFMRGFEYLSQDILIILWHRLHTALQKELRDFKGDLQAYFKAKHPHWISVGRLHFHLAEKKDNLHTPFAFLASFATRFVAGKVQHLALSNALKEAKQNKETLLSVLLPIQNVAKKNDFIRELIDSGDIFHPLFWSINEAHQFLKAIPICEEAGIIVRVPDWWKTKKLTRPQVSISIGKEKSTNLGMETILDFDLEYALDTGEKLTQAEWQEIVDSKEKLVFLKGQWVEINQEKLDEVLNFWKKAKQSHMHGLSFLEAMRLLAGTRLGSEIDQPLKNDSEWFSIHAGKWLHDTLDRLRKPGVFDDDTLLPLLSTHLKAHLRAYQLKGVQWLWLLYHLRLGGCLADDMGLGKTIQIIALLLLIQNKGIKTQPHLLIIPASIIGNWKSELERFAPSLCFWIAHPSDGSPENLQSVDASTLSDIDVIITTYSFAYRLPWINTLDWDMLVLDEAQAIKNPNTKQAKAIKSIKSKVRFTLTGTPIENRFSDLWSLFDFMLPGLLGSASVFNKYEKAALKKEGGSEKKFYSALRQLVAPYILRRMKTDKSIIADLPDKTEIQTFCGLSKHQAGLYQQAVDELTIKLKSLEGIERRGVILSYLMRFKQICNHPTQWLGNGEYSENESGKFYRLRQICEQISAKQEKVLIFTQFKELIPALNKFLSMIFKCSGLVLHGSTAVRQRKALVDAFQAGPEHPYFILSLKAGGVGLNLTAASHVIHFDRWWNPAVENQATDRAYRIGQKRNVLVHKFICRGTIEEKIDLLINAKKGIAEQLIEETAGNVLTEMTNAELINTVSLDIHRALEEI